MNLIFAPLNLIGRLCLVTIFLMSAVGNKIPKFNTVSDYMASAGVPMPQLMLAGAIVFLIAGSLFVAAGYKARLGALLLLTFLVLATYWFHDFWNYDDPEIINPQMIAFMKNLGLAGAMLMIIARGPGPLSINQGK